VGSLCRQIWRGKEIGMRRRKGSVGCKQQWKTERQREMVRHNEKMLLMKLIMEGEGDTDEEHK